NRAVVRTELAADLPAVVGDRVQLQQVFLNLIMNGLEAMSAVTDRPRELRIDSRQSNDMDGVLIEVRDCGAGIESESMDQLFDPFLAPRPRELAWGYRFAARLSPPTGDACGQRPTRTMARLLCLPYPPKERVRNGESGRRCLRG